jgi:hypothetical protein
MRGMLLIFEAEQKGGVRRPLEEMVHYETYDLDKYRSTRQTVEDLAKLRGETAESYRRSVLEPRER